MSPSRVVRAYLPLDAPRLRELLDTGKVAEPPAAFAVTSRLERAVGVADREELEYAALLAAAAHAAQERGRARVRRVVVAADLPARAVAEPVDAPDVPAAQLRLTQPLLLRQVASLHVDEQPGGSTDADLLWYDATELDTVITLLE